MDETIINETVPYVVYEGERARAERLLKDERERHDKNLKDEREANRKNRLLDFAIIALLIIALAAYIAYDVWQDSSNIEETTTTTYKTEQDTNDGGSNYYYGGDYYGAPDSNSNGN